MNCKEKDLAVIVQAGIYPECLGMIVRVTKVFSHNGAAAWETENPIHLKNGRNVKGVYDKGLRPIRDQPGQDQTIQWAGLPGMLEIDCGQGEVA